MTATVDHHAQSGREAARLLLDQGIEAAHNIADPLTSSFADSFVETLSAGMSTGRRGWVRNVMDGTGRLARNLNVEAEHGLVEVIQNADDLGAHCVRFVLSPGPPRRLLLVHNGARVQGPHVLAMTLALVSTKGADAMSTGKFGIGLKTLNRLADRFEVHSPPYDFAVADQHLSPVGRHEPLKGVWDPAADETLLALALRADYPDDGLRSWLESFSADSLLFLSSVRRLELRQEDGVLLLERELADGGDRQVTLSIGDEQVSASERTLRDQDTGRTWTRLSVERTVPDGLERSDKLTPQQTPLAVAHGDERVHGRLFAGLPLAIGATLPFSANAQFDTDASRTTMVQERWNEWVLDELASLSAAAALHRLAEQPAESWTAIPLREEVGDVTEPWLREQLTRLVDHIQDRVRNDGRMPGRDGLAPIRAFTAEIRELEGLLDDSDLEALSSDQEPLVGRLRDEHARWRLITDELEVTDRLSITDALAMLDWPTDRLGTREPEFFLRLAAIALGAGLSSSLERAAFIALADGGRVSPRSATQEGLLLVIDREGESLGHRLGVVRPLAFQFAADTENAKAVREYLTRAAALRTRPATEDALRALARRAVEEPVYLQDGVLIALREALRGLSDSDLENLGPKIGQRILVDGREYERGRQRDVQVRPARAYLPSAIDRGTGTWATAAHRTAGLQWVHPRYARDLRPGRRRSPRAVLDLEAERTARTTAQQQRLGARSLFGDLGAETAPRLQACRTDLSRYGQSAKRISFAQLTRLQQEALSGQADDVSGLIDDYESPDLQAVCEDIAKTKIAEARPRAQAVLSTLNRAWGRLYASHLNAAAVNAYYGLNHLGPVPASWRALAAEVRWMTSEARSRRAPRELGIRTPGFLAMFGEAPRFYAHGLDASDAGAPAVQALGFENEPRATTLVTRLEELRAADTQGKGVEGSAVSRVYAALAAAAPTASARGARRHVDNLPVREVQRRFRKAGDGGRGLVRTENGSWRAPSEVFIGRAIFGEYANFVSEDAERLWLILGMRRPDWKDCVATLHQVSTEATGEEAQGLLWEVYRELVGLLPDAPRGSSTAVRSLPLWTTSGWSTGRPVYAVADPELQLPLSEHLSVWQPPGPLQTIEGLIAPLGVELLAEDTFEPLGISTGALAAGSTLKGPLQSALRHLQEWLALHDPELHDRISSLEWEQLVAARVAVNKRLHVEIRVPGRAPIQVAPSAHVRRSPGVLFAFRDRSAMESSEVMGARLAYIFGAEDRELVVLEHGWLKALARLNAGTELSGMRLSTHRASGESDGAEPSEAPPPTAIGTPQAASEAAKATRTNVQASSSPPTSAPLVTRKLKRLNDITAELEWIVSSEDVEEPKQVHDDTSSSLGGLRPPVTPNAPSFAPAPPLGAASWTPAERETLGFRLLARELKRTRELTLSDLRKQRQVGADAIDQNGVYYELKVSIGGVEDSVSLTPSEFERAQLEGTNFILVVISGMETGYDTRLKLIPDPLRSLNWSPGTDIQLYGIRAI
jgi:hypothetical protein